jgi:hypothetical protein
MIWLAEMVCHRDTTTEASAVLAGVRGSAAMELETPLR